jgi:hypothetical protein
LTDPTLAEGANAMSVTEKPPLSRRLQVRAFRIINVPMRVVLGLPVATPLGRSLMLAFIRGRKTGKLYRQPISYVRDGDTLLTPGGGKWKLNLRPEMPVRIRLRGKDLMATPELVSDPDEIDKLLTTIVAGNPRAAAFIGVAARRRRALRPGRAGKRGQVRLPDRPVASGTRLTLAS